MKNALRRIAVTVVEQRRGRFNWQLLEQGTDGRWEVLEHSSSSHARYDQAMAAGLLKLERHVENLAQGPRVAPADDPVPASDKIDEAKRDAAPGVPGSGKFFGFGPLV